MANEATATRDYSAPPSTEFEGREYRVEFTFCLTNEATEDQVWEWVEFELGGGSIASAHPLVRDGACMNRVEITDLRSTGRSRYIDWGAASPDGRRSGKVRTEYDDAVSA